MATQCCSFLCHRSLLGLNHQGKYTRQMLRTFCSGFKNNLSSKDNLQRGPGLEHFLRLTSEHEETIALSGNELKVDKIPYLSQDDLYGMQRNVFFDVSGCQMNINDVEIAWSILKKHGFQRTTNVKDSDVILIMTCSVRENAEDKIWNKLQYYKHLKLARQLLPRTAVKTPVKIGVLGCMAERLKQTIIEKQKAVDLVCGPDAYRDLPRMLAPTHSNQTAVNVLLSLDETYCDVIPVRLNEHSPSAFVSVMRGCDNMCSYCIVPFTRGRERSRPIKTVLEEIRILSDQGIKEVILLGQNVNSYRDTSELQSQGCDITKTSQGFSTVYKPKVGGRRFAELLDKVSMVDPEMRIRFTSPHPKDFPDEVLHLIKDRVNICSQIHLPAQSGNNEVLQRMQRGYTREAYIDLVNHIRDTLPDIALTSDFIAGFCGETEEAHKESLSLIERVKYSFAFCFPYSMREKTRAFHRLNDDIPQDVKDRRHKELVATFRRQSLELNMDQIGNKQLVLVEGISKRSEIYLSTRNEANVKVIIPQQLIPDVNEPGSRRPISIGDYVAVQINDATSQTLIATPLYHTTLQDFAKHHSEDRWLNSFHVDIIS
ncbi:hypothetical protein LSH36_1026g00005 [Paralvinella palmiformis]|uniref:CDK5 regulatory subunit-associated protein 1 n=1 Tax=Paralvinella palmiformis TaxID=53620 RepID=A0AAD9IVY3_9ANNE|nr:hypothetical protein LSH36_1026g00005 [Paralvinella palmiformis]